MSIIINRALNSLANISPSSPYPSFNIL
jgi:hypothetical protein